MIKRSVVCDGCKKEAGLVGCFSLSIEQRRAPRKRNAIGKRKVSRNDYFEVDLCPACSTKPVMISALIAAAKKHEVDDGSL